jgi:hypothetical protein
MTDRMKAQSIRMFADAELAPEEAAEIRRSLEADERQQRWVEFEQRLRQRVGSVMQEQSPAVPADLAARVRAALAEADAPGPDVATEGPRLRFAAWFAGPRRANVFAVAASLALVAGAVLWGIFGPQIDTGPQTAGLMPKVASHVAEEHSQTATDPAMRAAATPYGSRASARERLSDHLQNRRVQVPELSAVGYELIGGGPCRLPGRDLACHLLYKRTADASAMHGPALVSLHVVIDPERGAGRADDFTDMPLGGARIEKQAGCPNDVFMWSDGSFVYFLVCCDSGDLLNVAREMQERQTGR